ncbi:MAG: hypothetical protein FWD37_05430, partial [Methanomassiliicoccaceae archaeon]|nr:hypothetical protein [Methanomassiliicoccaceae archaeon]
FDRFRKGDKEQDAGNKIEKEIRKLHQKGRYDEIISRAPSFINDQNTSSEMKKMVAQSYYAKEMYDDALALFEQIASEKNDKSSWLDVSMTLIYSGKVQEGEEIFKKILEMDDRWNPVKPEDMPIPYIRFSYAWCLKDVGLFDAALEQLEHLKRMCMQLERTDDGFLHIHGIPPMSFILELTKIVFNGMGKDFSRSDFLDELERKVDGNGKKLIKKYR